MCFGNARKLCEPKYYLGIKTVIIIKFIELGSNPDGGLFHFHEHNFTLRTSTTDPLHYLGSSNSTKI